MCSNRLEDLAFIFSVDVLLGVKVAVCLRAVVMRGAALPARRGVTVAQGSCAALPPRRGTLPPACSVPHARLSINALLRCCNKIKMDPVDIGGGEKKSVCEAWLTRKEKSR